MQEKRCKKCLVNFWYDEKFSTKFPNLVFIHASEQIQVEVQIAHKSKLLLDGSYENEFKKFMNMC